MRLVVSLGVLFVRGGAHSKSKLRRCAPQSLPGMVESIELRAGGLSMAPCPMQDATRPRRRSEGRAMVVGAMLEKIYTEKSSWPPSCYNTTVLQGSTLVFRWPSHPLPHTNSPHATRSMGVSCGK